MSATILRRWALGALMVLAVPACGSTGLQIGTRATAPGPATTAATVVPPTTSTSTSISTTTSTSTSAPARPRPVPVNVPDGWQVFFSPNVAVGAPAGWVDAKPVLLGDSAGRTPPSQDPAPLLGGLTNTSAVRATMERADVLVMRRASASATVVGAYVQRGAGLATLDQIGAELKAQASKVPQLHLTTKRATVAGRPTLVIDMNTAAAGGAVTEREYVWLAGQDLVLVTFATSPGTKPAYTLWAQMVGTVGIAAAS